MNSTATLALLVLTATAALGMPSALPPLVVPDGLGVNIHFAGREDAQVEKIAVAGFRFIRMDFTWGSIEAKKGEYDFRRYDDLVDSLASRGIRAIFILDYGNGNYDKGLAPRTKQGIAGFAAFARASASAAHFRGKGVIWEVWNEPNRKFWTPKPDPGQYVVLVRAAYAAIKEADPDCMVVGPAVNRWDYGYIESALRAGLLECVDAVSLHPYDPAQPEDAEVFYARVRSLIRKYAPAKSDIPIISGEWGYNTSKWGISLERQADYITRMFLINAMSGCPVSIWYDWRNDGDDFNNGEFNYGVVYHDLKEKPAYAAVRTLSAELGGYAYCRRIANESGDDHLLLFRNGEDYRLAAWTAGEPHSVSIPLDVPSVAIVSQAGERKDVEVKDGVLTLDLGGSVQYLEPATPSRRWAMEAAWDLSGRALFERGGNVVKVRSGLKGARAREVSRAYVWDGSPKPQVTETLTVEGLTLSLSRTVELDTSECLRADVLPPVGSELLVEVSRPLAQSRSRFLGRLTLGNGDGIRLASESVPVELGAGKERSIVRIGIAERPSGMFALSCTVLDARGREVVRTPVRRYQLVESFGGKPGDEVSGYRAEFDDTPYPTWSGKSMMSAGKVSLSCVEAPDGSPVRTCARLDYTLTGGKCSAQIVPVEPIVLPAAPRSLRVWVKGDGNACSMRFWIDDSRRETFQPDCGLIDFTGWRCIEADMTSTSGDHWGGTRDGRMECPLEWKRLFMIDNMARDTSGSLYFGPVMLGYE